MQISPITPIIPAAAPADYDSAFEQLDSLSAAFDRELPPKPLELKKLVGEIRGSVQELQKNISVPKKSAGRLFTFGRIAFGWEDVILTLVLVIIIVSWLQGQMDYQQALVALMGTGAGGAWGVATGRASA